MDIDMRLTAAAIPVIYLGVAAIERVPRLQFLKSPFLRPSFLTDVGWYVSAVLVTLAFGPIIHDLSRAAQASGVPTLTSANLPIWILVPLVVMVYDLLTFASHVILHRVGWLWRVHKVHHSSPVLDWLATTRAHVSEHLFRGIPAQLALLAIGFPLEAVAIGLAVYAAFATLNHSNLRLDLRLLEGVFITPRLHRLHHVPETTNRNFAAVFSFWDRMAGSLVLKDSSPDESLGVPGEELTYPQSWWRQLREPFRRSRADAIGAAGGTSMPCEPAAALDRT
jgi:sterol desaturase/sphingolipid hydroxylase (fatty acid hydroxylase superfamily)